VAAADFVKRVEEAQAARGQVLRDGAAARAALEVGRRAVLAGEEARGQAVVGDDALARANGEVAQRPFALRATDRE
jgi:hypothetical protein